MSVKCQEEKVHYEPPHTARIHVGGQLMGRVLWQFLASLFRIQINMSVFTADFSCLLCCHLPPSALKASSEYSWQVDANYYRTDHEVSVLSCSPHTMWDKADRGVLAVEQCCLVMSSTHALYRWHQVAYHYRDTSAIKQIMLDIRIWNWGFQTCPNLVLFSVCSLPGL